MHIKGIKFSTYTHRGVKSIGITWIHTEVGGWIVVFQLVNWYTSISKNW